ncbi:MAG: CinA family protein [Candidatus Thermoplasmatota archaeon]|nr:CinA family protein [Candidatus Thermoplasmatota archaeon]MBS3802745.1 CinA family protein [Candidatus Thermoplasmatota archaeon]
MISNDLIESIAELLTDKKLTVATAESCTGGLLGHVLTSVSGSSVYYDRGIISYTNQAKQELLNVSLDLLQEYGAVSKQVARSMAKGVRKNAKADIGVSTTGIAGPTGGTKKKPVGLVYIGLSTRKKTVVNRFVFDGDRLENKDSTCIEALRLLQKEIVEQEL